MNESSPVEETHIRYKTRFGGRRRERLSDGSLQSNDFGHINIVAPKNPAAPFVKNRQGGFTIGFKAQNIVPGLSDASAGCECFRNSESAMYVLLS